MVPEEQAEPDQAQDKVVQQRICHSEREGAQVCADGRKGAGNNLKFELVWFRFKEFSIVEKGLSIMD